MEFSNKILFDWLREHRNLTKHAPNLVRIKLINGMTHQAVSELEKDIRRQELRLKRNKELRTNLKKLRRELN